jgi:hypothetical protein
MRETSLRRKAIAVRERNNLRNRLDRKFKRLLPGARFPHVLVRYLLQRFTDHRHSKPCRNKGERTRGAVRFLDDPRAEEPTPSDAHMNTNQEPSEGIEAKLRQLLRLKEQKLITEEQYNRKRGGPGEMVGG